MRWKGKTPGWWEEDKFLMTINSGIYSAIIVIDND